MQRRSSTQISSFIISFSVITIILQFAAYYLFTSFYLICGLAGLISIVCCHILLEQTSTYEACFQYSFLTLFISLIILVLIYLQGSSSFLPYTTALPGIAVINWLFPFLYGYLRYMFDFGTKADHFIVLYRNSNIVFCFFYLILLAYGSFAADAFPWAYRGIGDTFNVIPFHAITIQIEEYLYNLIPLSDIIVYLLVRILSFVPYGFFIAILLYRQGRVVRFFALLLLPFILEAIQYIIIPPRSDIDDIIYALLGGFIGCLLFYLNNAIFRAISGKDFLINDHDFPYTKSSLHF